MNRIDFIEIARVIRVSELDEPTKLEALDKEKLITKLVVFFKATNPRFIESQFRKDCNKVMESII